MSSGLVQSSLPHSLFISPIFRERGKIELGGTQELLVQTFVSQMKKLNSRGED